MENAYNTRNPGVKRLMQEAKELNAPAELYYAQPLEDNLFEWHFTVRGPPDTEFDGGIYHGRIILPTEYPMKPPSVILLTPNGRFELNKKICLSISGYHPESWQPSWSIRTALLAIIGFMPTPGAGALGALDYTPGERKALALKSKSWKCSTCGVQMCDVLPVLAGASSSTINEAKQLGTQILFTEENKKETSSNASEVTDDKNQTSPATGEVFEENNVSAASIPQHSLASQNDESVQQTVSANDNNGIPMMAVADRRNSLDGANVASFTTYLLWAALVLLVALLLRRLMMVSGNNNLDEVVSDEDTGVLGYAGSEPR